MASTSRKSSIKRARTNCKILRKNILLFYNVNPIIFRSALHPCTQFWDDPFRHPGVGHWVSVWPCVTVRWDVSCSKASRNEWVRGGGYFDTTSVFVIGWTVFKSRLFWGQWKDCKRTDKQIAFIGGGGEGGGGGGGGGPRGDWEASHRSKNTQIFGSWQSVQLFTWAWLLQYAFLVPEWRRGRRNFCLVTHIKCSVSVWPLVNAVFSMIHQHESSCWTFTELSVCHCVCPFFSSARLLYLSYLVTRATLEEFPTVTKINNPKAKYRTLTFNWNANSTQMHNEETKKQTRKYPRRK